jgi:hypothetical protein
VKAVGEGGHSLLLLEDSESNGRVGVPVASRGSLVPRLLTSCLPWAKFGEIFLMIAGFSLPEVWGHSGQQNRACSIMKGIYCIFIFDISLSFYIISTPQTFKILDLKEVCAQKVGHGRR